MEEHRVPDHEVHVALVAGHYFIVIVKPGVIIVDLFVQALYLICIERVDDVLVGHE